MSPTVFREKGYRFFFFSREESRMHVHVICSEDEAKYWLDPDIELAKTYHLNPARLKEIERLIEAHYHEAHYHELTSAWKRHFRG